MGSNEFESQLKTYSKKDIEQFAIDFLKEEVIAVLQENGWYKNQIIKNLESTPSKTINQAVEITTKKLNPKK